MHKSRSVCNLLSVQRWKNAPENDWIYVCTCCPLKLLKLVYVIKKTPDILMVECCMDGRNLFLLSGN